MAMWHTRGYTLAGAGVVTLILLLMMITVPAFAAPVTAADWYSEGNNFSNQKRFDMAIQAYDQAIALDPSYARAFFARGQAQSMLGEHAGALADYEKAIALEPGITPMVTNYFEISENILYPEILSGSLIKGYWVSGWRYLEVDNKQGVNDIVIALVPKGSTEPTIEVYIKKGYYHLFEGIVPPGAYDFYITYGERWNSREKQFDNNAGYLKWTTPYHFEGASGNGYSMIFVVKAPYPNWYVYTLSPVPESGFPEL